MTVTRISEIKNRLETDKRSNLDNAIHWMKSCRQWLSVHGCYDYANRSDPEPEAGAKASWARRAAARKTQIYQTRLESWFSGRTRAGRAADLLDCHAVGGNFLWAPRGRSARSDTLPSPVMAAAMFNKLDHSLRITSDY